MEKAFLLLLCIPTLTFGFDRLGLVADEITMNGPGNVFKGFNSHFGPPGALSGDGTVNENDQSAIRCTGYPDGEVNLGNTSVYGYLNLDYGVGFNFGPNGGVYSFANPGLYDPSRIFGDGYGCFVPASEPVGLPDYVAPPSIGSGNNTLTGGVYYLDGVGDKIFSTPSQHLVINGEVVLIMTNDASLKLYGDLTIEQGASLTIYTNSDVDISGAINNSNTALDFSIYGTNTTDGAQDIRLSVLPELTAFVYAPTANVSLEGGGGVANFFGAIVAYDFSNGGGYLTYWSDLAIDFTIYKDSDCDGLSNHTEENTTLTDPSRSDTDSDGLSDGDEVNTHGTNPLIFDTSGDGLSDGSLVGVGFDPTVDYSPVVGLIEQKVEDARAGSSLIQANIGNTITLRLQVERSTDLNSWTASPEDVIETTLPLDKNKEYFRFGIEE